MMNIFRSAGSVFAGTSILFVCLFLLMLGVGLQGSLVSIRGIDEGFSTFLLSFIASCYYVGFFVGSIVVSKWLKRVGYIRVYGALVAIASVAAVAYAMFVSEISWLLMRFITGICIAGICMICESWLNTQTHNENRAKVLGLYVVVLYVGLMLGQFFLNLGDVGGYFLFAVASVVISIASVPLLLTTRPAPTIEETATSLTIRQLYKRSPLGVVSTFFANYMSGSFGGLAAIFAKNSGMPTATIAIFIACSYIGVIIFQLPIGYLSDRIDRRKVMLTMSVVVIAVVIFAIQTTDNHQLIIISFLLGAFIFPLYALCLAYVNDRLAPEEILPATSALLKITGAGNMIAPILTGWIMVNYGSQWFFGMLGVAAAIITIFGLFRMKQHGVNVDEQGDFAPITAVTTAATMSLTHEGIQLEFDFGEQHRKPIVETEKISEEI